ncbi:hypothetical protein CNYM01_01974 [Colletotrichum nymphaeae SA-01]|uniref:DUF6546 domain-containing protein n=1 Tax=Colletotrichum nymphaeae SA-01 TaxID=1460502 RepID=A0A135UR96_9PEZI|nr:hypothetical protein CNYM01_01974 [Colletotrichum nymphaeae SA-01]
MIKANQYVHDSVLDRLSQKPATEVERPRDLDSSREHEQNEPSSSWSIFPQEVRLMILDAIVNLHSKDTPQEKSRLASVSAEWQMFFEEHSFKALELTGLHDITMLEDFVNPRRQMYVSEIYLHVYLATYTSEKFCKEEDDEEILHNIEIFDEAVMELWQDWKDAATLFRYEMSGHTVEVSHGASWDLKLHQDVWNEWENVARYHGNLFFDIRLRALDIPASADIDSMLRVNSYQRGSVETIF